jgi:LysR family transcriptional regulator, glycine cleavage system transcriptional activator
MIELFPGLRSLRAFDAASRHLSFTRAAADMRVTPAAISHQIKEIEDQLGVSLFQRTSRTMHLTREGEMLQAAAAESLETLGAALQKIRKLKNPKRLNVSASPSIGAKWLVPRLDRFLAEVPGADVHVDVSASLIDFERDDIDIAIRFGKGNYPGMRSDILFQDHVFPVCSPSLIHDDKPLKTPRDLLRYPLIHLDWDAEGLPWPNWRMWMLAAGVKDFDADAGLHFSQTSLAVQAAINCQGIALGDSNLVADDLAVGRLIKPFELSLRAPPQFAYYVISPLADADAAMVKAFREWSLKEAAQTAGQPL